jgi:uncharacterized MAPEG superfamily protein
MTVAELSLLAVVILWLATIGVAKGLGWRDYDNARPRSVGFYADGWRARALGAHQNGLEALPFFAAAVLLAEFRAAPQALVDGLAAAFVVVRLADVAAYIGTRDILRSVIWSTGFLLNIALFLSPLAGRAGGATS